MMYNKNNCIALKGGFSYLGMASNYRTPSPNSLKTLKERS